MMTTSKVPTRIVVIAGTLLMMTMLAACSRGSDEPEFGIIDWPEAAADVGAQPGELAPNFRLETSQGEVVALSEQVGQPILLNFFASWCLNCREEMTDLDKVPESQAKVIGIDLRESAEVVNRLAEETGATFVMGLDREGNVSREYRATSLPVTLLLDSDGIVLEYVRGPVDTERIDELLATVA